MLNRDLLKPYEGTLDNLLDENYTYYCDEEGIGDIFAKIFGESSSKDDDWE